ncbi:MAG: CoA-binding protein [Deltaproteobacteria bacterium]|nr:CoA-binding protein [Deltaproteobacteria bacterium]
MDFFFNPKNVAIVGASIGSGKLSAVIMENLVSSYGDRVYPVNPKYESLMGLRCYPSLKAIGDNVDLAVFAVSANAIPGLLREAEGVLRGAIIISGGFGEAQGEGERLDAGLRSAIKDTGIRVIGPNCLGVLDAHSGLDTFFIPKDRVKRPKPGRLSILSQSGSFALTAVDELAQEAIGVSRVVSYGNMADVDESELLEYLAHDEMTGAVALYIESVGDGRRFVESARRCSMKKPVMAVKVGRFDAGVSAARSHTGALAGRYELYRAGFRKASIIEAHGYEEFIDGCKALGSSVRAKGKRVVIITDGGGVGVNIADACVGARLEVDPVSDGLKEDFKKFLPPYCSLANPIDLTGSVLDEWFSETLAHALKGDLYDMAIVAPLWGPPGLTDRLPRLIAEAGRASNKPVIVCTPGGAYTKAKMRLFRENGFAVFTSPESAARAAGILATGA